MSNTLTHTHTLSLQSDPSLFQQSNSLTDVGFKIDHDSYQRELRYIDADEKEVTSLFPGILSSSINSESSVDAYLHRTAKLVSQPKDNDSNGDHSTLRQFLTASGGAVKFTDTPLRTAEDFSKFVHTLAKGAGWKPHIDKGLMVLRRQHADNVATANEGPPHHPIGSHNEYGLSSHYPSYIAFFCLSEPEEGGETPIASSLELYQQLQHNAPEYIKAITEKGVSFSIHHPRDKIDGSLQGNGLFAPNAFGPADGRDIANLSEEEKRSLVEENVKSLAIEGGWKPSYSADKTQPIWKWKGYGADWLPDGSLIVRQRVPGVRLHPIFRIPTYFNNIHNRLLYSNLHGASSPPFESKLEKTPTGTPIYQVPPHIVEEDEDVPLRSSWIDLLNKTTAEVQADVKWRKGDVLLLDNLAVQHARRTWKGDRRLLASLWDTT